ncbi:MAG: hypothetical protein MHMPM18_000166 [Marteilia pararefringens]
MLNVDKAEFLTDNSQDDLDNINLSDIDETIARKKPNINRDDKSANNVQKSKIKSKSSKSKSKSIETKKNEMNKKQKKTSSQQPQQLDSNNHPQLAEILTSSPEDDEGQEAENVETDFMEHTNSKNLKTQIISEVDKCLDAMLNAHLCDQELLKKGKPATKKLALLKNSLEILNKSKYHKFLINNSKFYDMLGTWLEVRASDKILPNLTIRTALIKFIDHLTHSIPARSLKHLNIGKSLKMMSRHKNETAANKKILLKLLNRWYNELFEIQTEYVPVKARKTSKKSQPSELFQEDLDSMYQDEFNSQNHHIRSVLISDYHQGKSSANHKDITWQDTTPSDLPRATAPRSSYSTYSVMPLNDSIQLQKQHSVPQGTPSHLKQRMNRLQSIRSNLSKSSKS